MQTLTSTAASLKVAGQPRPQDQWRNRRLDPAPQVELDQQGGAKCARRFGTVSRPGLPAGTGRWPDSRDHAGLRAWTAVGRSALFHEFVLRLGRTDTDYLERLVGVALAPSPPCPPWTGHGSDAVDVDTTLCPSTVHDGAWALPIRLSGGDLRIARGDRLRGATTTAWCLRRLRIDHVP